MFWKTREDIRKLADYERAEQTFNDFNARRDIPLSKRLGYLIDNHRAGVASRELLCDDLARKSLECDKLAACLDAISDQRRAAAAKGHAAQKAKREAAKAVNGSAPAVRLEAARPPANWGVAMDRELS